MSASIGPSQTSKTPPVDLLTSSRMKTWRACPRRHYYQYELARASHGPEVVASAARADHPYRDQTGRLTRSTRAYAPRGRFLGDTLAVEVIANIPYATNVADHYREDWLERALTAQDGRVEHELERALARAVAVSNFG
jgi:hypothetical protein